MMPVYKLRRFFTRGTVFIILAIFIVLTITHNSKKLIINDYPNPIVHAETEKDNVYRNAGSYSPFGTVYSKKQNVKKPDFWTSLRIKMNFFKSPSELEEEEISFMNWDKGNSKKNKIEKCRVLIYSLYEKDPTWTNSKILKFYNIDSVDNQLISLLGERLRLYDYCFISGGLDINDVIKGERFADKYIDGWDFQYRMFPFFNEDFKKESKQMWPIIRELSSDNITAIVKTAPKVDVSNYDFNINFWHYWTRFSKGKGISTTMAGVDIPTFIKQMKVLQKLNNTFPIQLITTGNEYSESMLTELSEAAKATNQKLFLVDVSSFFDRFFLDKYIRNFFNKWLAVIFNTFEETIFIDADAVPFEAMSTFFDIADYQKTGIYMYQDRTIPNEHTFHYCIEMLYNMEPSIEETNLFGTKLFIDRNYKGDGSSTETAVYKNFFENHLLHHVDSGLIVVNKAKKLNGLLMSFLMHLDAKMQRCVYGDKEVFWLGQLFAGESYSIDPIAGGIVGPMAEIAAEKDKPAQAYICATQIAHADVSDKIVWTNGGLKTCKINGVAPRDFKAFEEYFKERYQNVDSLNEIYNSPLKIEGLIIPDSYTNPWQQINECARYMYCAFVTDPTKNSDLDIGKVVHFNEKVKDMYNDISAVWNS